MIVTLPCRTEDLKTLNHCPDFPARFGSIQHARTFADELFTLYNHEHVRHEAPYDRTEV